ncbi:MAG: class I SAM-dependent methyltransferase [Rhodospirillales bacterium]|nr:class I SAM-dependent methyltransferase [Rhodospirillales bacterium]
MPIKTSFFALAILLTLFGSMGRIVAEPVDQITAAVQSAIGGDHRSAEHKARDTYRHPLETLTMFGIKPEMTVVEISPGGKGWYTEILAPLLRDRGKLYAASYNPQSEQEYYRRNAKTFTDKLMSDPSVYDQVAVTVMAKERMEIAPDGSADMVLTFRNVHNWIKGGYADAVFAAMYKALKPGGILGLVEHRADPDASSDRRAVSGYVSEAVAVELAERAGFSLAAKSEINSNTKDTKDHPKGVWTLPPSYRLGDVDREKYTEIGESDRMTLKFVKPAP